MAGDGDDTGGGGRCSAEWKRFGLLCGGRRAEARNLDLMSSDMGFQGDGVRARRVAGEWKRQEGINRADNCSRVWTGTKLGDF
jgi:hypothetical protein